METKPLTTDQYNSIIANVSNGLLIQEALEKIGMSYQYYNNHASPGQRDSIKLAKINTVNKKLPKTILPSKVLNQLIQQLTTQSGIVRLTFQPYSAACRSLVELKQQIIEQAKKERIEIDDIKVEL